MRRLTILAMGLAAFVASAACNQNPAGSLLAAADTLNAAALKSIEYTGTGKWYQFGQAPSPGGDWPEFDVSSFTSAINYDTASARVEMVRRQVVDPARARAPFVEQRPNQFVSGTSAWNLAVPAGSPAGTEPAPAAQPAAVEERRAEIWTTPHGFLKAAAANNATSTPAGGGSTVAFTVDGKYKYTGTINAENHVESVTTWIDNPVTGDTAVEVKYSDYKDMGGIMFPGKIVKTQGGHPVLDITVTAAKLNPAVDITVPEAVKSFTPPAINVVATALADGVYYMTGGSHHSIAIDQKDHIVVVEGPQNEARSLAVIAKVKETIPNKPIKYLVNTHHHFDHSGGVRTYVDEGATIVTHEAHKPFYGQAWAAPHTINPDKLEGSKKAATFETFGDKHVLTDGSRPIELHLIQGSGHSDGFVLVYLPKEKILVEVDAWAPLAPNAPPPAVVSPFVTNLNDNIKRLKLDVKQIAALHGPRVATMVDFVAATKPTAPAATN